MKVYSRWSDVPNNLKTENSLIRMGIYKKGKPVAICKLSTGQYELYDINEALSLEKQKGNKMLEINSKNKYDYLIMEMATTGESSKDEIVQLVLLNMDGHVLVNQYFKPRAEISKSAYARHQINKFYLKQMPQWDECWDTIREHIQNKILLIPNTASGKRLFEQTCDKYGVEIDFQLNYIYSRESIQHKFSLLNIFKTPETEIQDPLKDSFETLKILYPKSPLYEAQIRAHKYFNLLCEYQIKNGKQGAYESGYQWLQKTFRLSMEELDFYSMDYEICLGIISGLETSLRGLKLI